MPKISFLFIALALAWASLLGCGSGDLPADGGTLVSANPRCQSLCASSGEASVDVCSSESALQCVELCEARLSGTDLACADCLLEGSAFEPAFVEVDCITESTTLDCAEECFFAGRPECRWCLDDGAARDECKTMVGREVACEPAFRPAAECADLCE